MSLPTTPRAYDDCYEIFDKAMADPVGVRVKLKDYGEANWFRLRMNQARSINRKENMRTYSDDHPMFNSSVYDILTMVIDNRGEEGCYLEVKKRPVPQEVESLSGDATFTMPEEAVMDAVDDEVVDELASAVDEPKPLRRV